MDNLKKKNVKPKLLVLLKAHRGNNNNDAWMLVLNKLSILEQFGWQVIKHESWSRGLPYYHLSSNHSFTRSHVNIGHRFRKSRNLRIATDIWQFLRRLKVPQTLKAPTEPWLKLNSLQNDRYISANLRSPQSLMGLTVPCICICFLKRGGVRTDESCPVTKTSDHWMPVAWTNIVWTPVPNGCWSSTHSTYWSFLFISLQWDFILMTFASFLDN